MSRGLAGSTLAGPSRNYGAVSDPEVQFSPTELYNLSENITTNIYTINSSWKILERASKCIGTNKDNQGLRDQIHVTQLSTNQIVAATGKDLNRLTVVVKRGDKQQKLQVEKLTSDFSGAAERYYEIVKLVTNYMKSNPLLVSIEDDTSGDVNSPDQDDYARRMAQIQALRNDIRFEHGMLLDREIRIRQVQGDMLDVHQIMRELGALIHKQGDYVDSTENTIDSVAANVELGNAQVLKASEYGQKYRRKLCILLMIALVVAGILLWVLISSFKKNS